MLFSILIRPTGVALFAVACAVASGCGSDEGTGAAGVGATNGFGGVGGSGNVGVGGNGDGCPACDPDGAEIADNGCDDDCNQLVDDTRTCDSTLTLDDADPISGARAIDLCRGAMNDADWGVIDVAYTLPAGEPAPTAQMSDFDLGHGITNAFGVMAAPRAGIHMLALSSGAARDAADPGFQPRSGFDKGYISLQPSGFPSTIPACGVAPSEPHDGIALTVSLRVAPNARALAFDFAFFSADFPSLVCSEFNDIFTVRLTPAPAGIPSGNLTGDSRGNPISVAADFFEACDCDGGPPCDAGGLSFECPLGSAFLNGTGYEGHGATEWLTTSAPVEPGSVIQLVFSIWDSGDGLFDSTVLIDNFRWVAPVEEVSTTRAEP